MAGFVVKLSSKRLWTLVVAVVLICAAVVVGVGGSRLLGDDREPLRVRIVPSTNSTLVGEPVTFEVQVTSGRMKSWLWDFGDGNISTDRSPTYTFTRSSFFNVSVLAFGNEVNATDTVVIPVQNHDVHEVLNGDVIAYPTRRDMPYDLIYFDIHDGITRPHVTGRWSGTSATVEIAIFIMTNPTNLGPRLVSEGVNVGVGDFDLTREADAPEDAAVDCQYIMVLQSNGGAIVDYQLELWVEY